MKKILTKGQEKTVEMTFEAQRSTARERNIERQVKKTFFQYLEL